MNKRIIELAGLKSITEKKWISDVDVKSHPPKQLFASGTAAEIKQWLVKEHSDLKSAMSSLNFYINRAGKNLPDERKEVFDEVKLQVRKAFEMKNESIMLLRKMAGIPSLTTINSEIKEEPEEPEEVETPEEQPEETSTSKQEMIAQVAKAAEGKSGEELVQLITQVYDAGFDDGKAEQSEEKVEESYDEDEDEDRDFRVPIPADVLKHKRNGHLGTGFNSYSTNQKLKSLQQDKFYNLDFAIQRFVSGPHEDEAAAVKAGNNARTEFVPLIWSGFDWIDPTDIKEAKKPHPVSPSFYMQSAEHQTAVAQDMADEGFDPWEYIDKSKYGGNEIKAA